MNERWLYTISQLYQVKYKIYNSFDIFFSIRTVREKETTRIKSYIKSYL